MPKTSIAPATALAWILALSVAASTAALAAVAGVPAPSVAAATATHATDAAQQTSGTVFDDRNGNGAHDGGEPGIANVGVSNGRDIVRTSASGAYVLTTRAGDTVFVIKPAEWKTPRRVDGLPAFWQQQPAAYASTLKHGGLPAAPMLPQIDFALQRAGRDERGADLDVLVFADPQPKSAVDIDYYHRDIVQPLVGSTQATLGLTLGDITNDDLSLYPAINATTTLLGVPWLHAAGNHDVDSDAVDDASSLDTFRHVFGPDTFAWEEARASFVLLDDVITQPGQRPAYIGGLREEQFKFLQAYLARASKDRLLVIALHIPLFEDTPGRDTFRDADRTRLFALLQPFPHVLLLSAHSHTQRHWMHDADTGWHGANPLHEYNVGAACGAYWSGVFDDDRIPDSTMADGTPNGYATLKVRNAGAYDLAWQPARDADQARIGVTSPGVLRQGAYPAWGVFANVYMGRDDTRVEFRIDDGDWQPMRKVLQGDPWLLAQNVADRQASTLRGFDRAPEAELSPHLWRAAVPTTGAIGQHRIDIRAFDAWDGEVHATTTYEIAPSP